jgi:hypothetical protein
VPELHFHVRWPDGSMQRCCSPLDSPGGGLVTVVQFEE